MAISIRPTGNPGEYDIGGVQKVKLVQWREGDIYDTVLMTGAGGGAGAGGAVPAGTELILFRDVQNKDLQHTNLKTPRRLPSDSELIISRIGAYIMQSIGTFVCTDADIIQIAHSCYFYFKVGERMVSEGPVLAYQSGYGVTGSTTRNATGVVTVGVASAAAAPQLLVAQPIDSTKDLDAKFRFPPADWLNQAAPMNLGANRFPAPSMSMGMQCYLHGFIKRPHGE